MNNDFRKCTIHINGKKLPIEKALLILTHQNILDGKFSKQTIIDMKDALKLAIINMDTEHMSKYIALIQGMENLIRTAKCYNCIHKFKAKPKNDIPASIGQGEIVFPMGAIKCPSCISRKCSDCDRTNNYKNYIPK